jgi:Predicted glycosyltransferases
MVAILLVNYNGADDTIECICSLEKITMKDYYIVVIDNCSTDDSIQKLELARQEHAFHLLRAESNKGFSAGNNLGINFALNKGAEHILLLNNDTLVESNFLRKLLDGFAYSENCGAVIGKIFYVSQPQKIWYAGGSLDFKTARIEHWHYGEKDVEKEIYPQKVSFASGCCLCLSAEAIKKTGLLNEEYFLYEEDTEYCYRLMKNELDIIYMPSSVIYHKVSASVGRKSPTSQFYTVRNKYYFIHTNFKGINRWNSFLYVTIQFLFRCMKREMNIKYYIKGLKAYLKHQTGRVGGLY